MIEDEEDKTVVFIPVETCLECPKRVSFGVSVMCSEADITLSTLRIPLWCPFKETSKVEGKSTQELIGFVMKILGRHANEITADDIEALGIEIPNNYDSGYEDGQRSVFDDPGSYDLYSEGDLESSMDDREEQIKNDPHVYDLFDEDDIEEAKEKGRQEVIDNPEEYGLKKIEEDDNAS